MCVWLLNPHQVCLCNYHCSCSGKQPVSLWSSNNSSSIYTLTNSLVCGLCSLTLRRLAWWLHCKYSLRQSVLCSNEILILHYCTQVHWDYLYFLFFYFVNFHFYFTAFANSIAYFYWSTFCGYRFEEGGYKSRNTMCKRVTQHVGYLFVWALSRKAVLEEEIVTANDGEEDEQ